MSSFEWHQRQTQWRRTPTTGFQQGCPVVGCRRRSDAPRVGSGQRSPTAETENAAADIKIKHIYNIQWFRNAMMQTWKYFKKNLFIRLLTFSSWSLFSMRPGDPAALHQADYKGSHKMNVLNNLTCWLIQRNNRRDRSCIIRKSCVKYCFCKDFKCWELSDYRIFQKRERASRLSWEQTMNYPGTKNVWELSKTNKVSSFRTPMLIQGRLDRTETNPMHFKWEVT